MDVLWAIDSELEDILGDAKGAATAAEQGALSAATVAQAVKAKGNAESDKATLGQMVKRFLVRSCLVPSAFKDLANPAFELPLVSCSWWLVQMHQVPPRARHLARNH